MVYRGGMVRFRRVAAPEAEIYRATRWRRFLQRHLDRTPVPATLEVAVLQMLPLMRSLGFVETDLREHARECIEHMRTEMQSAEWEGPAIDLQYAGCIRSYTHEDPPCYRVMSGALNNTAARMQGLRLSDAVRMVLPYCKLLDVSLQALPACYHYRGEVYRGVKWAFPNLRNHRLHFPHYFHAGRELCWHEPKSTSTDRQVVETEFLGDRGARTLFTVHITLGYKIQRFSDFAEHEVLVPMLTDFTVLRAESRLHLDASSLRFAQSSTHTGDPDHVELQQINRGPVLEQDPEQDGSALDDTAPDGQCHKRCHFFRRDYMSCA